MPKRTSLAGKNSRKRNDSKAHRFDIASELAALKAELAEAKETLRAIQCGDVDAVVVSGPEGDRVFTLKGAEYAYRSLVEAMNEGAATLSQDGVVLYCNKQFSVLAKIAQERVIGHPVRSLVPTLHCKTFETLFTRALAGESGKTEIELQGTDGTLSPVYVSLSSVEVDDAPAVCMVVTDLTEHKRRDELIAAGNLAQSILEHAVEAIAVCDPEGRIILANDALGRLCGTNPLLRLFDDVMPVHIISGLEGERRPFSAMGALNRNFNVQEVVLEPPGRNTCWLLLTAGPLETAGQIVGCIMTLLDVTERKAAERALLRSEKLAATGRMAATIAHEVNNPLSAVMNAVYIAATDPTISEGGKSALQIAADELERIAGITRQTLGFYRETSEPTLVDCGRLLDDVRNLYGLRLKNKDIAVEKRYREAGPILAVAGEVRQVISNLLANAIDAASRKGVIKFHVKRVSRNGSKSVQISIADNGMGISPADMKRIFEPFFTTKQTIGTGLGLWVCKELVEKHGGTIRVRSRIGKGTVFSISFPAGSKSISA
jgi:PAS domain S-box-containing protein